MRIRFVVLFLLFTLVSAIASATIVNGNVPSKGSKKYSLKPGINGWVNLVLTNTAAAADLDLFVTVVDPNGVEQGVGSSSSVVKQLEKLTVSVNSGSQVFIYVDSFTGSSAFRLAISLEGEVVTASAPNYFELREVPMDAKSLKTMQSFRAHSIGLKH